MYILPICLYLRMVYSSPFEIMFNGDNDTVIPIDKDNFDTPPGYQAMQDRIWVRWMDPKELEPLTDEEVAEYRKSIGK